MDANTPAFLELSALLTGLDKIVTDPEEKKLNEPIADEYLRRISAVLAEPLTKLLNAYKTLASANPPINDDLLNKLRATPGFKTEQVEFAARQIVNIWYFSQFKAKKDDAQFLDGGFYERGAVWSRIKAHPIGFSDQPHGYWTRRP